MHVGDYGDGSGLNIILKEESSGNYYYQNMEIDNWDGFNIFDCTRSFLPVACYL